MSAGVKESGNIIALLLFLLCANGYASDKSFWQSFWRDTHGEESLSTEYVGDNGPNDEEAVYGDDDDFWIFKNRLHLQAQNRQLESSLLFESTFFHLPPALVIPPEEFVAGGSGYTLLNYENDIRVQEAKISAHSRFVHITLGDFPITLGRGIALSLIQSDEDASGSVLRGGNVEFRVRNKFGFVLAAGLTNTSNVDPVTKAILADDAMDRIVAFNAMFQPQKPLKFGIHGVVVQPRFESLAEIPAHRQWTDQGAGIAVLTGGGSVAVNTDAGAFYGEMNVQQHDNYRVTRGLPVLNETGTAGYASVSRTMSSKDAFANMVLQLEGIYYKKWLMEGPYRGAHPMIPGPQVLYHQMPTLEEKWVPVVSLGNELGSRLTGTWHLKKTGMQITQSTALLRYLGGVMPNGKWDSVPTMIVVHPIVKLRHRLWQSNISMSATAGFRYETTDAPTPGHSDSGYLWHLENSWTLPVGALNSLKLKQEVQRHHLGITENIDDDGYWVAGTTVGFDRTKRFGAALVYEYSDELSQSASTQKKFWGRAIPLGKNHFGWLSLKLHGPKRLENLSVELSGGVFRGGLKCVGGVCRIYPNSVGAKAVAVYRF